MIAWVLARMSKRKSVRKLQFFAGFGPDHMVNLGMSTIDNAIRFARCQDAVQLAEGWSNYVVFTVCEYDFTDERNPKMLSKVMISTRTPMHGGDNGKAEKVV